MPVEVYFDGLCEPINPGGIATYGYVIYVNGVKIYEGCGCAGAGIFGDDVTNNVAEYIALIKSLEWLIENGYTDTEVRVYGDSQLVIMQINGRYSVRSPRIVPLFNKVNRLLSRFKSISLTWIPRDENKEADNLSKKAYYAFLKKYWRKVTQHYPPYLLKKSKERLKRQ